MKLLMHTCCAPCSIYCIDSLRQEGIEPTVYWYNPNIHPYIEYKTRRDTLKEYTKSINVEAIFEEEYGLDNFCKNVIAVFPSFIIQKIIHGKYITVHIPYNIAILFTNLYTTLLYSFSVNVLFNFIFKKNPDAAKKKGTAARVNT